MIEHPLGRPIPSRRAYPPEPLRAMPAGAEVAAITYSTTITSWFAHAMEEENVVG